MYSWVEFLWISGSLFFLLVTTGRVEEERRAAGEVGFMVPIPRLQSVGG